jgi:hypothetical protein
LAASASRNADSKKSMVAPAESIDVETTLFQQFLNIAQ